VYNYEENQIVTSGTDRKIAYWETLDGSPIRELEGSMSGAINGMDITQDGHKFITGGDDKVKIKSQLDKKLTFFSSSSKCGTTTAATSRTSDEDTPTASSSSNSRPITR
jgi:hypothetical protein